MRDPTIIEVIAVLQHFAMSGATVSETGLFKTDGKNTRGAVEQVSIVYTVISDGDYSPHSDQKLILSLRLTRSSVAYTSPALTQITIMNNG